MEKELNEKSKEKWLRDIVSQGGLDASIDATIQDRSGRTKIAIFETNAILEDVKMQVLGGIRESIDIWELAIIPMLLNNCDTWIGISEDSVTKLENLQNLFLRIILQVPISCPKPALCWETATIKMKFRIWQKKLNLYKYLQLQNTESLASNIFNEQSRMNFPGLIQECTAIAKELNILNALENKNIGIIKFKAIIKEEIKKNIMKKNL